MYYFYFHLEALIGLLLYLSLKKVYNYGLVRLSKDTIL